MCNMATIYRACILMWLVFIPIELAEFDNDGYHPRHASVKLDASKLNTDWWQLGTQELNKALGLQNIVNEAKNIIVFIGDGMGISTQTAATFLKTNKDATHPSVTKLSWYDMPHLGLSKTYNVEVSTADSSSTATAILSGFKTQDGTVGVSQEVARRNCTAVNANTKLKSILKYAHDAGKWTGVVTTTRLTHATPASAYANCPDRDWENDLNVPVEHRAVCKDIARQLVEDNSYIRVILGGGRQHFMPNNVTDPEYPNLSGYRGDNKNLLEDWKAMKQNEGVTEDNYKLVMNKTEFDNVNVNTIEYLFGIFQPGHMNYEHDRLNDTWGEPSLTELTQKAIQILKRNTNGFVLLVEGGRIDHGHHDNIAYRALHETLSLSSAVDEAMQSTSEADTLILVTADHSHVFTFGAYGALDQDVFRVSTNGLAKDGKPYTVLGYVNGPGFYPHRTVNNSVNNIVPRMNLSGIDTTHKTFEQDGGVPFSSETHGGEEVAIYARGPYAHLFHSIHEQSYIARVMMYASCLGPDQGHCQAPPPTSIGTSTMYNGVVLIILLLLQQIFAF